jgi:uncharacterized protein YfaS (alpha-2-macroglobulin family)
VEGQGVLRLLKISYDENREPVETEVQQWNVATNAQGDARQQLVASAAGQYRLSYTLDDGQGHKVEGGYVFTVVGEGFDAARYRFEHLELVPDKAEYAPGEKVRLMVNTDRPNSTVLLFLRPVDGVYLPPQLLRISGQSTVVDVDVKGEDMPNFLIEALTIADGQVHTELKDVVVPPEQRVYNVRLEPSKEEYGPGEKAQVKLALTDVNGKPVTGSVVLAMYDKALEYISGGSNVPEIREFFWQWRRSHYPQSESNLQRWFSNMVAEARQTMEDLGIFGGSVVDEISDKQNGLKDDRLARTRFGFEPQAPAAAAPAPAEFFGAGEGRAFEKDAAGAEAGEAPLVVPTVRTKFADTALWVAALQTDGDGVATVSLSMPENLTTWKVRSWAMGSGTRVGEGTVEVITTKNLLVRLQAPRFFVETDEVVLSCNVHNYLKGAKRAEVSLELEGSVLELTGEAKQMVEVPADGEVRVDWRVRVTGEGEAVVRAKALTDEESDAMELRFPAYVHGMLKTESLAGVVRPDQPGTTFTFSIPDKRRPEMSRFELRYSPSLAAAMVDALPYLAEYPYGCTEQTLNRFLPTVVTQKILREMNLDLA